MKKEPPQESSSSVQAERLKTDCNVFIDRAIEMLKEEWCFGPVAGINRVLSLLQYAKESHAAKFEAVQSKEGLRWVKASERLPEKKGEYLIRMQHKNDLPEDAISKDVAYYFPKSGWQDMEGGWTVIEWLDESPID